MPLRDISAEYKQNIATLSFKGKPEAEFLDEYFEGSLKQVRIATLLGALFYGIFGILDVYLVPDSAKALGFIRYAIVCPFLLLHFLFSFTRNYRRFWQLSTAATLAVAGLGIIAMMMIASDPASTSYYAGLILIFIYNYTFLKLRFIWATVVGLIIVAAYEIVAIGVIHSPAYIVVNNNFFFLAANLFGMFAGYSMEYYQRRDFQFKHLLKFEKQKVSEANKALEHRVEERTAQLTQAVSELRKEVEARIRAEVELTKAKENAEAANRAKSVFLASMSHEMRTPLNHIIGFTDLLAAEGRGKFSDTHLGYINDVQKSGTHLLDLINDLLDISEIETGRMVLSFSEFDPQDLLSGIESVYTELANQHEISLLFHMENLPIMISADKRKLRKAISNLVSNAIKFTPAGGKVRVDARVVTPQDLMENTCYSWEGELERVLEFLVSDSGIGIKSEDQDRIFDRFHQTDQKYSREYNGAGLGLNLTKNLVELHGGRICVQSDGQGKGSIFRFFIPLNLTSA